MKDEPSDRTPRRQVTRRPATDCDTVWINKGGRLWRGVMGIAVNVWMEKEPPTVAWCGWRNCRGPKPGARAYPPDRP